MKLSVLTVGRKLRTSPGGVGLCFKSKTDPVIFTRQMLTAVLLISSLYLSGGSETGSGCLPDCRDLAFSSVPTPGLVYIQIVQLVQLIWTQDSITAIHFVHGKIPHMSLLLSFSLDLRSLPSAVYRTSLLVRVPIKD